MTDSALGFVSETWFCRTQWSPIIDIIRVSQVDNKLFCKQVHVTSSLNRRRKNPSDIVCIVSYQITSNEISNVFIYQQYTIIVA